jgi:hypothetical protein
VDDLEVSVAELARALHHGGVLCAAIPHPLTTAGDFASEDVDSPYVITRAYGDEYRRVDTVVRDGLSMVFTYMHRPLAAYVDALRRAGLMIEFLSEPVPDEEHQRDDPRLSRQRRAPTFLHLRAVRRAG